MAGHPQTVRTKAKSQLRSRAVSGTHHHWYLMGPDKLYGFFKYSSQNQGKRSLHPCNTQPIICTDALQPFQVFLPKSKIRGYTMDALQLEFLHLPTSSSYLCIFFFLFVPLSGVFLTFQVGGGQCRRTALHRGRSPHISPIFCC